MYYLVVNEEFIVHAVRKSPIKVTCMVEFPVGKQAVVISGMHGSLRWSFSVFFFCSHDSNTDREAAGSL